MPRRMSYSPATAAMHRMVAAHAESDRTGVPVDELLDRAGPSDSAAPRCDDAPSSPARSPQRA